MGEIRGFLQRARTKENDSRGCHHEKGGRHQIRIIQKREGGEGKRSEGNGREVSQREGGQGESQGGGFEGTRYQGKRGQRKAHERGGRQGESGLRNERLGNDERGCRENKGGRERENDERGGSKKREGRQRKRR